MRPKNNAFVKNGKSLVSKVHTTSDLKKDIESAVSLIGGFKKLVKKGDTVLVKPNYVYAKQYPATTSPKFLRAVIELLQKHGARKVIIGESSVYWQNTRKIMQQMGVFDVAEETNSEIHIFDDHEWVKAQIPNAKYQSSTKIPKILDEVNKLVFLPNCKTHKLARFTMSLKLAFGCTKKTERIGHFFNLEPKIAEIASVIWPDICIMDARKCMVTGGPDAGDIKEPNLILASGDRIALDIEGIKLIRNYHAQNLLTMDPWELPTIKKAIELGLGSRSERDYKLIEK